MSDYRKEHLRLSKLNQIVQNFFAKAAQIIIQSRVNFTPVFQRGTSTPKLNKWFNLELEETDGFREELRLWKTADVFDSHVPPLIIETYLDLHGLAAQQALVLVDSEGRSWPVSEGNRRGEVVLERWIIELLHDSSSNQDLPIVYKKAIILFRSLYTYCRLLPCWIQRRKLSRSKINVSPLNISCRIINGSHVVVNRGRIGLSRRIIDNPSQDALSHLQTYNFGNVETPAGDLKISVSYRIDCDFRISDSEAVLSTHFLTMDASKRDYASVNSPTGTTRDVLMPSLSSASTPNTASSLTKEITEIINREPRKSSFSSRGSIKSIDSSVGAPSAGTSGITAAASASQSSSFKPSVSFIQPFKTPPLSASPSNEAGTSVSSRPSSFSRNPSNSSLAALRIPNRTLSSTSTSSNHSYLRGISGQAPENAISSSASSDSIPKYNSSFGSRSPWVRSGSVSSTFRPKRSSFAGEESGSLASGSSASSIMEPGSGFLIDDYELGEFVKMVDSARIVKPHSSVLGSSVNMSSSSVLVGSPDSSDIKNMSGSNPLARFQVLRGSHSALSDSLQSSIYKPKSETSSFNAASAGSTGTGGQSSYSISSSAGKSLTSHTPLVPSRLSEEFTADDSHKQRHFHSHPRKVDNAKHGYTAEADDHHSEPTTHTSGSNAHTSISEHGASVTSPLDIPFSPRLYSGHPRKEALSVTNSRTSGYDDMHVNVETESHHRSLSNKDNRQGITSLRGTQRRPGPLSGIPSRNRFSFYEQDDETSPKHPDLQNPGSSSYDAANDDDDLLFVMSDMHVTKPGANTNQQPFDSLSWHSDDHSGY